MIVSASRRTDIPALYTPWLLRRLASGFARVRNPFDPSRVRDVDLRSAPGGAMEALVLWTRDPGPLLGRVGEWESQGLRTLWLVTVTGYPRLLEPAAPSIEHVTRSIEILSKRIGPERISWRYDPVFLSRTLGMDAHWHLRNFEGLARRLGRVVGRCILSVHDDYAKTRRRLREAGAIPDLGEDPVPLVRALAGVASAHGLALQSCCEDLDEAGVPPAGCIDGALLDRLWGLGLGRASDPGQRRGCRCAPSVDIGGYDTCTHGCLYCYATGRPERAAGRCAAHDPGAEILI